uniref:Vacuolar protein sorting-associated protein 18 homolog n=1 Tax=Schistocephalus solidus TaxID=70667 RepID=A0A0V0JC48_SCHSO
MMSDNSICSEASYSLQALGWFRPAAHITHAVVTSDILFATTTANILIKATLSDRSDYSETEISHLSDDRVHNLFVDPRGCHIIVSMQSGTNFYTTRKLKLKQISKAKDLLFNAVLWNQYNESETTTQEILIGTDDGVIYEAMLSSSEDRFLSSTVESLWRELITLDNSLTSLAAVRYPPGSALVPVGEPQMCAVLATTAGRLYQFSGCIQPPDALSARMYITAQSAAAALREGYLPGLYASIFEAYERNSAGSKCIEFPMSYGYSDLKVYQRPEDEVPSRFAWLTASGLYCGHLESSCLLDSGSSTAGTGADQPFRSASLTSHTKLIAYPTAAGEHLSLPLGIALTAFHVVVAYADRVKVINTLDDRLVFSARTPDQLGGGQTNSICQDPVTGRVWVVGNKGVCQLAVENEDARIWRIYLERGEFEEARKFCKNAEHLERVNCREAEYLFSRGDYVRSAQLFAETSTPFEEIALRFSQTSVLASQAASKTPITEGIALTEEYLYEDAEAAVDNLPDSTEEADQEADNLIPVGINLQLMTPSTPLKAFLRARLERLIKSPAAASVGQASIVAVWLIELLLGEIGLLEDRCSKVNAPAVHREELLDVRKEFRHLITSDLVKTIMPSLKSLIYQLLTSHGNHEDFVFFAKTVGDHAELVDHYMSLGMYTEALFTLSAHPSCANLHLKYAVQLSSCDPKTLVDAWIRAGQRLDPSRLLPTILLLPNEEATRYLEFAVDQLHCSNQAVHHQLIMLYASAAASAELPNIEVRLLDYLARFTTPNLCDVFSDVVRNAGLDLSDPVKVLTGDASSGSTALKIIEPGMPYDPGFALRISMEKGCLRSTVFLLKSLGLYEQAVQEALDKNNVDLAKEIVNSEALEVDTQRALWLRIARHVISDKSNLQEATALLRESSHLSLEDVFPLFPDFVTIDQFKEIICESLDAYSSQIEQLKAEMRATVDSTNEIRAQLTDLKSHFEIIPENARCTHCLYALALRTFYVFPCGHFFHTDCLMNLVRPHLDPQDNLRLAELYNMTEADSSAIQQFRAQFDELVAKDCVLCGQVAIEDTDSLFFANSEAYQAELNVWT